MAKKCNFVVSFYFSLNIWILATTLKKVLQMFSYFTSPGENPLDPRKLLYMNAFIFVHLFKFCKVIVLVKIKKDFFFQI